MPIAGLVPPEIGDILTMDPVVLSNTSLADLRTIMQGLGISTLGIDTPEAARYRIFERGALTSHKS